MFKKIKEFILNLFSKKTKEEVINANQIKDEKIVIDNVDFDDELKLSFGSIVWANRFKNEKEKNEIAPGHQCGPFVIIGYKDGKYVSLYGTGKIKDDNFKTLKLFKNRYINSLEKNTYICVDDDRVLTKNDIIKVVGNLTDEDKQHLLKKIELVNNSKYSIKPNLDIKQAPLDVKDIISYNGNLYLIFEHKDSKLSAIFLKEVYYSNKFQINGKYCELVYDQIITINSTELYPRYGEVDQKTLDETLKEYEAFVWRKKGLKTAQRGSLLKYENKYFYVYGENGDNLLTYQVIPGNVKNLSNILVYNNYYNTDYMYFLDIPKINHNYEIVDMATEEELDYNKEQKKKWINRENPNLKVKKKDKKLYDKNSALHHVKKDNRIPINNEQKDIIKPRVISGAIVLGLDDEEKYIVIDRVENKIILVKESDLMSGNHFFFEGSIHDYRFIETMDRNDYKNVLLNVLDNCKNSSLIDKARIRSFIS